MGTKSKGGKTRKCFGTRHHRPELETRLPLFEGAAAKTPRRVRHIKPDFDWEPRTRPVFAYISRRKLPFFVGKTLFFTAVVWGYGYQGEAGGRRETVFRGKLRQLTGRGPGPTFSAEEEKSPNAPGKASGEKEQKFFAAGIVESWGLINLCRRRRSGAGC